MDSAPRDDSCRADLGRCAAYRPGHLLHIIHARLISESPDEWRTVTVSRTEGRELLLVDSGGAVVVAWHHRLLTDLLTPGERCLLHARHNAIAMGALILNVRVTGVLQAGGGPAEATMPPRAMVVDLSTGRGMSAGG